MYILELFYFILFLLAFRYLRVLQLENMPKWVMPSAFSLKVIVGVLFLVIYMKPDNNNNIPSDSMRYMSESKQLYDIANVSLTDYVTLLSGIGEDKVLIKKYLGNTFLWDSSDDKIINDARNTIRLHSLIHFLSHGSPFIHMLIMCIFSLIGFKNIFISILPFTKLKPILFFSVLLILPSTLFWTSGILKEPTVILGIGLFFRTLFIKENVIKKILYGVISIFILIIIKPYLLACLLLSLLFIFLYKLFNKKTFLSLLVFSMILSAYPLIFRSRTKLLIRHLTITQFNFDHIGKGGLFVKSDNNLLYHFEVNQFKNLKINRKDSIVELIHPSFAIEIFLRNKFPSRKCYLTPKSEKWKIFYLVNGAISYIKTTPINRSGIQLVKNIPEALINSYARPFPNDPGSSLRFPAMFEVWILSFIVLFSIKNRRKINKEEQGLIISLLIFAISLLLLIGWTTPVIGAIFRYRFPAQLALLIICCILIKSDLFIKKQIL